ncbi:MAG: NAD(P)/FAD-dependent oxidoreductase, partial [Acidobacteriota bacterium]
PRTAVIIGAGPAGLTAAFELLDRTDIHAVVLEKSTYMGGIARTVNYKGNRIDIGGHRFFSKSDRVMEWWQRFMPLQALADPKQTITYQRQTRELAGSTTAAPDPATTDRVMLLRGRKSRIYYLRRFFDYPISLSVDTLGKLGLMRTFKIGFSYLRSAAFPIRPETNLEEFFINRFGRQLYATFFRDYTEKVWGVPCERISAEWGAQRVKGLSITKAVWHFVKKLFQRDRSIGQKGTETSLIEQFLYPKLGPGQMWETVAVEVQKKGGEVRTELEVVRLRREGEHIVEVDARDAGGVTQSFPGEVFFSTMPVKQLVAALDPPAPEDMRAIADGLVYRDFITVGLLLPQLRITEPGQDSASSDRVAKLIKDNWIYIQEPDVQVGRLQIFNNWSPYLVADSNTVWLGLEYFCNEGDALWSRPDASMIELAKDELDRIGIIDQATVLDAMVLRVEKTYPAYFGSYERFPELRAWLDRFDNLFLIGRNGMHRYNNQDHSMLAAMTAVDNLVEGRGDKANVWATNTEEEYHEEKSKS